MARIAPLFVCLVLLVPPPTATALSPSDTHLFAMGAAIAGCQHLDDFEFMSKEFMKLSKAKQSTVSDQVWKLQVKALELAEKAWHESANYEPKNADWKKLVSNVKVFKRVTAPKDGFDKYHLILINICQKTKQSAGM